MQKLWLLVGLCASSLLMYAQSSKELNTDNGIGAIRKTILQLPPDTLRAIQMLEAAKHYINRPGNASPDIDSASWFIQQARKLSERKNSIFLRLQCDYWVNIIQCETKQWDKARLNTFRIAESFSDIGRDSWAKAMYYHYYHHYKVHGERRPAALQETRELIKMANVSKAEFSKGLILLDIADHYMNEPANNIIKLDSVQRMLDQARSLLSSKALRDSTVIFFNDFFQLQLHLIRKEWSMARPLAFRVATDFDRHSYYFLTLRTLDLYQKAVPDKDEKIQVLRRMSAVSKKQQDTQLQLQYLTTISDIYKTQGKLDLAENELLQLVGEARRVRYQRLHIFYGALSRLEILRGNYHHALSYALMGVAAVEEFKPDRAKYQRFLDVAMIYYRLGNYAKGLEWHAKAYEESKTQDNGLYLYHYFTHMISALIKENRTAEAWNLITKTEREFPPKSNFEKDLLSMSYAVYYLAVKNYDSAEEIFQRTTAWDPCKVLVTISRAESYLEQNNIEKAKEYAQQVLKFPLDIPSSPADISKAHFIMFQIDSAQGGYQSALRHLNKYKVLNDTLFNQRKIRDAEELHVQYETALKDQDIQLKEKDILLLNARAKVQQRDHEQFKMQSDFDREVNSQRLDVARLESEKKDKDIELNKRSIELMREQGLSQQHELEASRTMRNLTFAGSGLLLIILALVFNQVRVNKKTNRKLMVQQHQISEQNKSLQTLVQDKEWLLKEMHHRVKNNLQTVVSLLESQAAYLQNKDALSALRNSQNRIHAMSLIHQKLYRTESSASLDMSVYLTDLIRHLHESFNNPGIKIVLACEPIELDVSQAIPVGLIINEAVTNSLKYAFPKIEAPNEIIVSMRKSGNTRVTLTIADNGVGILSGADPEHSNGSLGLKLIKGLTTDMDGEMDVTYDKGVSYTITFEVTTPFHKAKEMAIA